MRQCLSSEHSGTDLLVGTNGADSIIGSFGNDELRGLDGDDVLSGGGDHDTLKGGAGDDSLFGDAGNDTAVFSTSSDVTVNLMTGGSISSGLGDDTLSSIENVRTGDGDDTIFGDGFANILTTGNGSDEVYAGDGNDIVTTGAGNDLLFGSWGNDVLNGGGGLDMLTGNTGADDFVFNLGDSGVGAGARDEVTDFSQFQNDDIDLTGFGGLDFIGNSGFSAAGQVRFFQNGGDTIVAINTVGNSGAEMQIELFGIINLTESDFLL